MATDTGSQREWTVLAPRRTVFEVGLVALCSSIASFLALLVVIGLSAATADADGNAPLTWRLIYGGAHFLALLAVPLLIGYVHARLFKRRICVRPAVLAWVIGTLPIALFYAVATRGAPAALVVAGLTLLGAACGAAGTMLGCRVGLSRGG